jgi:hypothetical protein
LIPRETPPAAPDPRRASVSTLDHVLEPAQRAGDDEPLEWAGLAALDAADVGEQLGMLFDVEAERRRGGGSGRDCAGPGRASSFLALYLARCRRRWWRRR